MVWLLGPVWRMASLAGLWEKPEGPPTGMSVALTRDRMSRVRARAPKPEKRRHVCAIPGAAFLLVTFLWPGKEKLPWGGAEHPALSG